MTKHKLKDHDIIYPNEVYAETGVEDHYIIFTGKSGDHDVIKKRSRNHQNFKERGYDSYI